MDYTKTTARRDEKQLSLGYQCSLYKRFDGTCIFCPCFFHPIDTCQENHHSLCALHAENVLDDTLNSYMFCYCDQHDMYTIHPLFTPTTRIWIARVRGQEQRTLWSHRPHMIYNVEAIVGISETVTSQYIFLAVYYDSELQNVKSSLMGNEGWSTWTMKIWLRSKIKNVIRV